MSLHQRLPRRRAGEVRGSQSCPRRTSPMRTGRTMPLAAPSAAGRGGPGSGPRMTMARRPLMQSAATASSLPPGASRAAARAPLRAAAASLHGPPRGQAAHRLGERPPSAVPDAGPPSSRVQGSPARARLPACTYRGAESRCADEAAEEGVAKRQAAQEWPSRAGRAAGHHTPGEYAQAQIRRRRRRRLQGGGRGTFDVAAHGSTVHVARRRSHGPQEAPRRHANAALVGPLVPHRLRPTLSSTWQPGGRLSTAGGAACSWRTTMPINPDLLYNRRRRRRSGSARASAPSQSWWPSHANSLDLVEDTAGSCTWMHLVRRTASGVLGPEGPCSIASLPPSPGPISTTRPTTTGSTSGSRSPALNGC